MQQYGTSEEGRTRVRTSKARTSSAGKKVGAAVVAADSITPEQLEEALPVQREESRELGEILLSRFPRGLR